MGELTTMPKYEAYKDSGVEWLGIVPEHWDISPLFSKATLKSLTNRIDEELLSVYLDKGVIRFQDVESKRTNVTSLDLSKYQLVEIGDFVLNNQQAWRGSVGVSDYQGIVSPAYLILKLSEEINPRFGNYFFRDRNMVSQYLICSKGVGTIQRNLYWPQLKRVSIALPSLTEQTAIANFLDKQTAQIDEAIAIKGKQIDLLKERKQIIIQQAVTQGLNPDAPMKDSGVDWIGEIPEHWNVMRLKMGTRKITDGAHISPDLSEEKHPFVSTVNIDEHGNIDFENCIYTSQSCYNYLVRTGCSPKNGDVLFSKDGTVGRTAIVDSVHSFVIASSLVIIRPKKQVFDVEYLDLILRSSHIKQQTDAVLSGSALRRISLIKISNLSLFKLPIEEQKQITKHCNEIELGIKDAIDIQKEQIEKLKEYKTTLINSAVTGKIKVPEVDSEIN